MRRVLHEGKVWAALAGALAGAALGTLPGGAGITAAALGAAVGAVLAAWLAPPDAGTPAAHWLERGSPFLIVLFFVPLSTMAVPPGADMAMHTALARALLEGGAALSPAWGALRVGAYPRGFSALVAMLSPIGLARAALVASALSYAVFWAGLAAMLQGPLRAPWPRTVAVLVILLSKTPQWYFAWGGNPTALALGLALLGAAALDRSGEQHSPNGSHALRSGALAALLLAGAAATHPMGACAGGLAAAVVALRGRAFAAGAIAACGLIAVLGVLALAGPQLSPRELIWIRDCAANQEHVGSGVLGDQANVATALAALVLLWKRRFRPVALSAGAVAALFLLFLFLPRTGLYPGRFAPLLLLAVAPLWALAAAQTRWTAAVLGAALIAALPGHVHWYQQAAPIATRKDLAAIACAARTVPKNAVIDGAYGDATQWIPALTGIAVTRPHQHVALFDETDAALAALPPPQWRFVGERQRYPPPIGPPPKVAPVCGGALYPLRN